MKKDFQGLFKSCSSDNIIYLFIVQRGHQILIRYSLCITRVDFNFGEGKICHEMVAVRPLRVFEGVEHKGGVLPYGDLCCRSGSGRRCWFREVAAFELVKLTIIAHPADGLSTINASMEGSNLGPFLSLKGSWEAHGSSMSWSWAFIHRERASLLVVCRWRVLN